MGAREILYSAIREQDEEKLEVAIRMIAREEIQAAHGEEAAEELREVQSDKEQEGQ